MPRKSIPSPDGPTRLRDIAERLGVHTSTVSRALNPKTRGLVTPELAQKIADAAAGLNYRPNYIASSLRTRRNMTVGVVLPDIQNATFPILVHAIEATLAPENYLTLVSHASTSYPSEDVIVDQLESRRVDGLILVTARRHEPLLRFAAKNNVPLVTITRAEEDLAVSSVVNDDLLSMTKAVRHLAELGHRRIAHLAAPWNTAMGQVRWAGFQMAMRAHNLTIAGMADSAFNTRDEGRIGMERLLAGEPFTAVVTGHDMLAIGCLDVMKERGIRCPQDISMIGHNDMPLVDMLTTPLTTLRVDYQRMGAEAARLMLHRLADPDAPSINLALKPELIVRRSTAGPAA
jgi:LacI family transcriptional regulator